MTTALLATSGGLNAAVALSQLLAESRRVVCVHVDYGQAAAVPELAAARALVRGLRQDGAHVRLETLRLPRKLFPDAPTWSSLVRLPVFACLVPRAAAVRAERLVYGESFEHGDILAHTRLNAVLQTARSGNLAVAVPLQSLCKHEVLLRGANLGAPFELTWSCQGAEALHCGHCRGCLRRRRAFRRANLADHTRYRLAEAEALRLYPQIL